MTAAPEYQIQNHAFLPMPMQAPSEDGYLFGWFSSRRPVTPNYEALFRADSTWKVAPTISPVILYISIGGLTSNYEGRDICFTLDDGVTVLPQHRLRWEADESRWSGLVTLPEGIFKRMYQSDNSGIEFFPPAIPGLFLYEGAGWQFGEPTTDGSVRDCSMPAEEVLHNFEYFVIPEFTEDGRHLRDISGMNRHAVVQNLTPDHIVDGPGRGFPKAIRLNAGNSLQRIGCQSGPMTDCNDADISGTGSGGSGGGWREDRMRGQTLQNLVYAYRRYTPEASVPGKARIIMHQRNAFGSHNGLRSAGFWVGFERGDDDEIYRRVEVYGNAYARGWGSSNFRIEQWGAYLAQWTNEFRLRVYLENGYTFTGSQGNTRDRGLLIGEHMWVGARGPKHDPSLSDEWNTRCDMDVALIAKLRTNWTYESAQDVVLSGLTRMIMYPDNYIAVGAAEPVPAMSLREPQQQPFNLPPAVQGITYESDNNVFFQEGDAPIGTGNLDWYSNNYPDQFAETSCNPGPSTFQADCWIGDIGNDQASVFRPSSEFLVDYRDPNYYSVPQPIAGPCAALLWRCTGSVSGHACDDPTELRFIQYLWSNDPNEEMGLQKEWQLSGLSANLMIYTGECNGDGFLDEIPTDYSEIN